jgi:hypothetical protein
LQIKARVTDPRERGEHQLSVFRSWEFDAAVVVDFDDEFRLRRATRLPIETFRGAAQFAEHVSEYRVFATDELLDRGDDWTERLHAAAD